MDDSLSIISALSDARDARADLARCNETSAPFGLELTAEQFWELNERRLGALADAGRVELGGGVLQKLVYALCDSPYIERSSFADVLAELLDDFYYYKNITDGAATDDELIERMAAVFNGRAGGPTDYMAALSADELFREEGGEGGDV